MKRNLPPHFRTLAFNQKAVSDMVSLLHGLRLPTVCENALCPNIGECFSSGTATFLILGSICTRRCAFCAIAKGTPLPVDEGEPQQIAGLAARLKFSHVVITSVTRDDLSDGGASHFARVARLLHQKGGGISVEVLIPDFRGSNDALRTVVAANAEVINHNIETVARLYPEVRPGADYRRSVGLLYRVKEMNPKIVTKSGLMLGLGETRGEVLEVMNDLREAGCELLTLGQYLRPSRQHHPVQKYLTPAEFAEYSADARRLGFSQVAAAPLVRSSYRAKELYEKARPGRDELAG